MKSETSPVHESNRRKLKRIDKIAIKYERRASIKTSKNGDDTEGVSPPFFNGSLHATMTDCYARARVKKNTRLFKTFCVM